MDLQGLRVLITRPLGRAADLQQAIAAAGGSMVQVPLLAVEALDTLRDAAICQHTTQTLRQLDRYQRVIAISVNAVHYGMTWIDAERSPRPLPSAIAWYGIGAATIEEFAGWGIAARGGSNGANSEALLALPELQSVRSEAILILRGVGGRETLATVLRERGATVDYAELYRRSAPLLDARQQQLLLAAAFDVVCVNSAETLQNLSHCLTSSTLPLTTTVAASALAATAPERYRDMAVVVPSSRVAQLALQLGFRSVFTAANAGTAATLAALQEVQRANPLLQREQQ